MEDTPNTSVDIATGSSTSGSRTIVRRGGKAEPARRRLHWPYLLLSLIIGALLWFGVDLKRMEDLSLDVEVEYQQDLPAEWQFMEPPVCSVRVTLRGTRQDVSAIRKEELAIHPEFPPGSLDGDEYNGTLTLLPTQVRGLPTGVEVASIAPEVIRVVLSKTITRYLTVEAGEIVGTPQAGYTVGKVHQIDPPAMPITATREFLSKITSTDVIRTREFNVDGGRGLVGGMVSLEPIEKDGEIVDVPGFVYMTVELDELPAERDFEDPFEVRMLIDSPFDRYADLNISPPSVRVSVSGPKSVIDSLASNDIVIYADIRERVPAAPGEYNLKCRAIAPNRIRVTRIEPDTVKWITHGLAAPD